MERIGNLIKKNNYKLLIFDLDGTLVDLGVNWEELKIALNSYLHKEGILSIDLAKLDIALEKIRKTFDVKHYVNLMKIVSKFEMNEKNYRVNYELINYINNSNKIVVIYSMNTKKTIKNFINKFFKIKPYLIISKENCLESKPTNKDLFKILKITGVRSESVLLIGNSKQDKLSGKMANIKTIILDF